MGAESETLTVAVMPVIVPVGHCRAGGARIYFSAAAAAEAFGARSRHFFMTDRTIRHGNAVISGHVFRPFPWAAVQYRSPGRSTSRIARRIPGDVWRS